MYAKLIDGVFHSAPKKVSCEDTTIYNPPGDILAALGYKPVTFTDEPEAPEGYHYEPGWEETDEAIVQTWTLTEDPDDIDDSEAYSIIFGGAE